jgi:anthranilate synthase component 1
VDTFGVADRIKIRELHVDTNPYELFKSIDVNGKDTFILESLSGPREMSEISIIGFEPYARVYSDDRRVYLRYADGSDDSYAVEEMDPLTCIRSITPRIMDDRFRYMGGAVGYISYDAVRYWERLDKRILEDYPYMEFNVYKKGIIYDHGTSRLYYFGDDTGMLDIRSNNEYSFSSSEPKSSIDKDTFIDMVCKAKEYILSGDIYQVVLSKRFDLSVEGNPLVFYSMLRSINPSPYMYYLHIDDRYIIGSSPEMLVRVSNGMLETFPIAGTRRVTDDPLINAKLREELLNDEKEIAEHTMLVDLARNDIGRVCRWGSVKVKEFMSVKAFSHVQHIVSHVVGTLREGYDAYEAFRAVFPAGTVTGAPKVRAMEIIDELEPTVRGPYAGAVGYFSCNGNADFAIAIRSMFINGRNAYIQAGAGIVADSIPENEWYETEYKARALLDTLNRLNGI